MAEERMLNDEILLGLIKANSGGGGGGTTDYEDLDNKPQIGGVTLSGNKSLSDLGAQEKLTAGMYININSGTISVKRDVSEDVDEVLTLTHDTSGGTNKVNAVLTVGGETIDSETFTTSGGTFHDLVQISFNGQAVRFKFKYLVASKTQSAGYENYIYNEYTDTFVETIGEESKLIIKSELDTALSGKQDTLTFDDTPTDGSNNPVKSNGIYDALALKQNATDNSLDTEAKTIVGAINEHEGDISSLMSGFTNLDNEVNGDATTYPYADVITIEDAVPSNLADCSVKIEPVQDLHGYDKPWVGGAGLNKFSGSDNTYTRSDQSATKWLFTNVPLSSEFTGAYYISFDYLLSEVGETGEALFYGYSNGTQITGNICKMDDKTTSAQWKHFSGLMTKSVTFDAIGCYTDDLISIKNIMVSATEGDFQPYTNLCPITGHTEVDVQRDGVNLIDDSNLGHGIRNNETGEIESQSNTATSITIPISIKGNTNYCISYNGLAKTLRCYYYNANMDYIGTELTNNGVFITPSNCAYYAFQDGSESGATDKWQLELGSTATPYEPYQGKTYTIALGDTIYGGTVDFDSGVMTVDRVCVDADTLVWQKHNTSINNVYITDESATIKPSPNETASEKDICSDYKTKAWDALFFNDGIGFAVSRTGRFAIANPSITTLSDFETAIEDMQICYELATPTTIQLTTQQIQLLKGQNTLTASTGQISVTVNGVNGAIGSVQEQANVTDAVLAELAADIVEQLPTAPTTDGAYVLTVTVADGTPTYSWESTT